MGLHVVYQLWFTNFESDRQAVQVSERLIAEFSQDPESLARGARGPEFVECQTKLLRLGLGHLST
jgi:hypothetical protein